MVKGWLADPSTYPEDLKVKQVFLWGSQQVINNRNSVAYLDWRDERVVVCWYELHYCCCSNVRLSLLKAS